MKRMKFISKVNIGFAIGILVTVMGCLLAMNPKELATQWENTSPGNWSGHLDEEKWHFYQIFSYIMVGFGLFLTGTTFYRWMFSSDSHSADL